MSNPTTPFSWQMPTATDLVTDLPADFEVFGQAVATSMADLLGGTTGQVLAKNTNADMDFVWVAQDDSNAIQNSIVDAKGDLIGATAADTPARLAVGTNGQVLTADSTAGTGLAWATPATSGMSLIATTTLGSAAADITFSSISGTFQNLCAVFSGRSSDAAANVVQLFVQMNGDTASNYRTVYMGAYGTGATSTVNATGSGTRIDCRYAMPGAVPGADRLGTCEIIVFNYKNTTLKKGLNFVGATDADQPTAAMGQGVWNSTSAVTSLRFFPSSGNFITGTSISLYGWS